MTASDSSTESAEAGALQTPAVDAALRKKWPGSRLLPRAAVIVGLVVVAIAALLWWQERDLAQAEAALERGEIKYAFYLVSKYLENHPERPRALALQARTLVAMGRAEEAIAIYDQAGAAQVEDLHAWARAFMIEQQWSHAALLLEQVLKKNPQEADALYELTACCVRLGKLDEALTTAKKFAEMPGQRARGNVFLGTIYGDMGNHSAAAEAYAKVLKDEPNAENLQVAPHEFYLQYGRALLRLGKPRESLLPLKHSVAAQNNAEALVSLGDAALQLGEPEKAGQAWEAAVKLDPLSRAARENLANLALQNKSGEQALVWLAPLADAQQLNASTAYIFQRAYTLMGDQEETERWRQRTEVLREQEEITQDLDNILADSPQSFWARVVRAYRFAEQENYKQAETLIAELLKEAPGETFLIELADAVYRRDELPALERIPINRQ